MLHNCSYGWKYFKGGDAGEKEFTVYIGSWDNMEAFATKINSELGGFIETGKDILLGDIRVVGKVFARFDADMWNDTQPQSIFLPKYGIFGCPLLREDITFWASKEVSRGIYREIETGRVRKSSLDFLKEKFQKALSRTSQIFGSYFYGNRQQYTNLIKKRFS